MKIRILKLINYSILILLSALMFSCKERARAPEDQKGQDITSGAQAGMDTVRPKVIYKAPAAKEPGPEEPKVYVVKRGEWLWDIARKEYGTAIGWFRIYEANRDQIRNPDLIYPGQKFIIPEFTRKH